MSDQQLQKAWYRKYRPYTMKDYCGERIKRTVQSRFTVPENRPNVMMIYGTRGCGKTTFARIISKYYLCENPINGEPCEQCEICRSINEILIDGETGVECPGVIEVDAAKTNGKNDLQEIVEEAEIAPIYTKYKIVIFDECHEISKAAQNSLLKIIEDVPPHLVVIFATTNPEGVIGTIHSRCQLKLEARKQSVDDMANRLLEISKAEQIETSMDALRLIAKKGDRVPRECINILENTAKNYGRVLLEDVIDNTGEIASEVYIKFFQAANKSLAEVLKFNSILKEKDIAIPVFFSNIMRFVLDAMYIAHGISLEDYTKDYIKTIKDLYSEYTSNDFDTLLQILEYADNNLSRNDDNKNELLLTTTAMRIGKIKLLSAGLSKEQSVAIKENKESVISYGRRSGRNNLDTESLKHEINPDMLTKNFSDLKGVNAKAKLLEAANVSLNPADDNQDKVLDNQGYLDEYSIMKMMESDD